VTYRQTLDYLYTQLPMFHRVGAAAYKADLNNTVAISNLLNHPENKFRSVHIAGTNGKGSTSHMLAAILQEAGYKTGLYTSPHLKDFRERIRINGKMIPENTVIAFVEKHFEAFEKIKPSFFEWTVGLAFDYFAEECVDVAVIETGLGGRLDSTNIISPLLSVITNIGRDHMNLLGDTLEKIATEKAGIIKKNIPLVIGEKQSAVENVFIEKAKKMDSELIFADAQLRCETVGKGDQNFLVLNIFKEGKLILENLVLDLTGKYQEKNVLTVLQSVIQLRKSGMLITDQHVFSALKKVKATTGLMGRWQTLSEKPLTICDVAHNTDGIKYVMEQIRHTPHLHLHVVLGVVNDKDVSGMLAVLPPSATYYFCKADIPRAMPADELKMGAEKFSLKGNSYSSVKDALRQARSQAKEKDLIWVGGSTFVVAEVL
jgi:dihydrofolate synthase/folylpolyglutamate synthase